jgi:predicted transposase YdaD
MYLELTKRKLNDDAILRIKTEITKRVIERKYSDRKQKTLLNFIKYGLRFANSESYSKFEAQLKLFTSENSKRMTLEQAILKDIRTKGRVEGRVEGEIIGEILGKEITAINMLKAGELSLEKIATYTGLPLTRIVELRNKLGL